MTGVREKFLKAQPTISIIISVLDVVAGVVSLAVSAFWAQVVSLVCSIISLLYLILITGFYKRDTKENISALTISALDVTAGILTIVILNLSVQVIATLMSGLVAFKVGKVAIQSEKAIKVWETLKPSILKKAFSISPAVGAFLAKKLQLSDEQINKIKQGERTFMEKIKSFLQSLNNNKWTIGGSIGVTGIGGYAGYNLYNVLAGIESLPKAGAIVIATLVALVLTALVEYAIIGAGAESKLGIAIRKIVSFVGEDKVIEVLAPVNEVAVAEAEAKAAAKKIEDEAKAAVIAEKKAAAALEKEAKAALKAAEKEAAKKAKQEAAAAAAAEKEAAAALEAEKKAAAEAAHQKLVEEMIAKIKAEQAGK